MKMPLATGVDLDPSHIVLDGDPARPQKGHSSPRLAHVYCGPWSPISATAELLLIIRSLPSDDLTHWNSGLSTHMHVCPQSFFFRFWPNLVCGRSRLVVHISMTSARSKVTELLKFRKLHFSRSISSAILTWSSKLIQQIRIQNPFVMHRLVQVKKNRIGGATGNCYWEWSAYAAEKTCLRSHLKLFTQVAAWQLKRQVIPDLWHTNRKCLVSHEGRRVKMVDYDSMGPSLHLVRARFLNFLLSKLSRDFKLHGMSILQDFQMAIFPYCSRLQSYGQECW